MELERVINILAKGKQLGKRFDFSVNGKRYWSSVGIQKWNNKYKVYIDEILESKMESEEYSKEKIEEFDDVATAIRYLSEHSHVNVESLESCKGQKFFNPSFN